MALKHKLFDLLARPYLALFRHANAVTVRLAKGTIAEASLKSIHVKLEEFAKCYPVSRLREYTTAAGTLRYLGALA